MDFITLAIVIAVGLRALKARDERRRIALLGLHLGRFQVELLMEKLVEGYLRALGEVEAERRDQVWRYLQSSETSLCEQLHHLANDVNQMNASEVRVSKVPIAYADRFLPGATFDLRRALQLHAQALDRAVVNADQRSSKARAFVITAELFLLQHTCHWFCKSKAVASARLVLRHQTSYAQVLAAVSPQTRQAYAALIGEKA